MRALTEAEARVIAVLLAARPDRERDRLPQIGVPRSTYHAVRRRAYEEGWLRDRYIPHPVPLGRPWVTTWVARPYADKLEAFVHAVSSDRGNVLLWTGTQVSMAVFFHAKSSEPRRRLEQLAALRLAPQPTAVTVTVDGPSVPVYFDFEGLWCHLAELEGTLAYPHGLGGGAELPEGGDPAASQHQLWAMGELLRRPFLGAAQGRGSHLVGPFGLPFSQRKLLARGWVTHRTLLDPGRLPPFQGRAADQIVLVTGTPKSVGRPEALFATLTRESRVYPFLFVAGADRWVLGALGSSAPVPAGTRASRRPVLPTLREHLEGIEITQAPASEFTAPVDHRYDRLVEPSSPATAAKP